MADVGGGIGAGIADIAGAAGGSTVGKEAAAGAGIGATVGTALEAVPVAGPFLHAIAAAAGAIGGAISGAFRDTFHPSPAQAEAWLTMIRIFPWLAMSNLDVSTNADDGSRLVRYFRIISGEVPEGQKGNTPGAQLHNPTNSHDCDRPYQCNDDPDEPLTSMRVMQEVLDGHNKWVAIATKPGTPHNPAPRDVLAKLPALQPHRVQDPTIARALLQLIRSHPDPYKELLGWSEMSANIDQVQEMVRAARLVAGEDGPDPEHTLTKIFGGDLTVHQPQHAPPAARAHPLQAVPAMPVPVGPPGATAGASAFDVGPHPSPVAPRTATPPATPEPAPFLTPKRVLGGALGLVGLGVIAWAIFDSSSSSSSSDPRRVTFYRRAGR